MSWSRTLVLLAAITVFSSAWVRPSSADAVALIWTAPGDDGLSGTASRYELRYSTQVITPENFLRAALAVALPAPQASGTRQTYILSGLQPQMPYYFAIRAVDEAGNWSALSNVATRAPTQIAGDVAELGLAFSVPWPNPARDQARFECLLPEAAHMGVEVFDVTGRRVRRLADETRPAGPQDLAFDLRDDHGLRLASGVYLVRARLGTEVFTRRLVITH